MSYTYTGRPFAVPYGTPGVVPTVQQNRDSVRFLLMDTDPNDWQLQDGEIDGLLSQNTGAYPSVYQAAIEGCIMLQARYTRRANMSVGDLSISANTIAKQYVDLRKSIEQQSQRHDPPMPYAGGTSRGDMDSVREDDDRPDNWAQLGQDDDPANAPDFGNSQGFSQVVPG
jgi:hypothetical protein